MRVLVADQEPEMLEAIARAFEVDVATSKATCIDLLRANSFDVLVACERLSDGSGLELLSQVGQRWPNVIRILAIEPARRALLKGHLGPFKIFETLSYPIDAEKLEAALTRAAEALAATEADDVPPARNTPASRGASPPPSPRNMPSATARIPAAHTSSKPPAASSAARRGAGGPGYPPLPPKGSKIVPLGSPVAPEYRIVRHNYNQQSLPGTLRGQREAPKKPPTLHEKAAALAAEAMAAVSAVVRYIKPQAPTRTPAKPAPRKKR